MHLAAATILTPLEVGAFFTRLVARDWSYLRRAVILYTAVGGFKATLLTDFLHTTIAVVLIIFFTLSICPRTRTTRISTSQAFLRFNPS